MSLKSELEAARGAASLREFDVEITETLQMTVRVKATGREEAEQLVKAQYHDSEHILDADNLTDVEFEASPVERSRTQDRAR
jgi:hypothetical protein